MARRPAAKKRKAAASTKAPRLRRSPAVKNPVTVRHYCQGIGDSHLLRFPKPGGGDFWMLIDCGVHSSVKGGSAMIEKVVADIAAQTTRLDVVVVTHEHWDHVSGFLTEAGAFAHISVGEVWMGWTEDPHDEQALELDKFKTQALAALQKTSAELGRAPGLSPFLAAVAQGVDSVLGCNFGAKGERVRAARDAARALAPKNVRYFDPKDGPPLAVPDLPNLRIYVLGPPRDPKLLGLSERASEMYGMGDSPGWPLARALGNAAGIGARGTEEDYSTPFDSNVGTGLRGLLEPASVSAVTESKDADSESADSESAESEDADPEKVDPVIAAFARDNYSGQGSRQKEAELSWRRIDADWLGVSADLAMQLDSRTNNTSLALAFEFVDSRRVMLFAADAQVGNWLSWHDLKWTVDEKDVTAADLLKRTVYYKVGHHGSDNATLKAKGLELMTSEDLAAFIPTNEADAKKVGWGAMPFAGITEELHRRTSGRVVRADDPWIAEKTGEPEFRIPWGAIRDVRHEPGLWVEFDLA